MTGIRHPSLRLDQQFVATEHEGFEWIVRSGRSLFAVGVEQRFNIRTASVEPRHVVLAGVPVGQVCVRTLRALL